MTIAKDKVCGRTSADLMLAKLYLTGEANPAPKLKDKQRAICEQWAAPYDAAEDMIDAQLVTAAVRLMRLPQRRQRMQQCLEQLRSVKPVEYSQLGII